MATELFSVVALPHSVADASRLPRVAVRLAAADAGRRRGQARRRSSLPALGADRSKTDASIELFDQIGPIAAEPMLDRLDPRPTGTRSSRRTRPVRAPNAGLLRPALAHIPRPARCTTPAKAAPPGRRCSPTRRRRPAPSVHPLRAAHGARCGGREPGHGEYDESRVTEMFDRLIGETGEPGGRHPARRLESIVDDQDNWLTRLAMQVHRARRFYERPESQRQYQRAAGSRTRRAEALPRPEPDFHERCTLVGDHPALQRRLGLVVDLGRGRPDRLRRTASGSRPDRAEGDAGPCRTDADPLRDRRRRPRDGRRTDDWAEERLRLGDAERFALLDMDPDGSALKLDRFLWTLPRLLAIEAERRPDPRRAHRPPLARFHRRPAQEGASTTQDRARAPEPTREPPSTAMTRRCSTPRTSPAASASRCGTTRPGVVHAARTGASTPRCVGTGQVVDDLPEEGFIQGTTATETPGVDDSPVHVHEADVRLGGVEPERARDPGSGSATRTATRSSRTQDADPDPVTPLVVTSEVRDRARCRGCATGARTPSAPGRSTWPAVEPQPRHRAGALARRRPRSPRSRRRWRTLRPRLPAELLIADAPLGDGSRDPAAAVHRRRGARERWLRPSCRCSRSPGIERIVLGRLRTRVPRRSPVRAHGRRPPSDRASLVARAFGDAVVDEAQPFIADTAVRDPDLLARGDLPAWLVGIEPLKLLDVVTPLRPFLRWDPVQPPAIVTRHRFTRGRVAAPARRALGRDAGSRHARDHGRAARRLCAPAHAASRLRGASERHLAPPKTSQSRPSCTARSTRRSGRPTPRDHKKLLAVALRESGTLFDMDVPRLDNPSRARSRSRAIASSHDPTVPASDAEDAAAADRRGSRTRAVRRPRHRRARPALPAGPPRPRGLARLPGGRPRPDHRLPVRNRGLHCPLPRRAGPSAGPFRLVLEGGAELLGASSTGACCTIGLPAGDVQRFRLASLARPRRPRPVRAVAQPAAGRSATNDDVAEAAADGWLWALTPVEEVTLVHAVPRPLEAPRPTAMVARPPHEGATDVVLVGAVDVHGAEHRADHRRGQLGRPGRRPEPPGSRRATTQAIAFTSPIRESEDLAVLYGDASDSSSRCPGSGRSGSTSAIQRLGDTRHHTIDYRFRASTRFREYFDPETLAPPAGDPRPKPVDDGQSVVGPEITLSVPSSARPAAPVVHSVLPLFRWEAGPSPSNRSRPGAGAGPACGSTSSGRGTRPARASCSACCSRPAATTATALRHPVSQWGADPVWAERPGHTARDVPPARQPAAGLRARGSSRRRAPGRPAGDPALGGRSGSAPVTVLGYRPQYSLDRQMWYVDVAIDPGSTFWPFVRLAVTRYQPDSIAGLSPLGARAVRLRPAHARADDEREPHRCPPRAGRGQRPDRGPRATTGARHVDRGAAHRDRRLRRVGSHAPRRRRPAPAARPGNPDRPRLADRSDRGAPCPRLRPQRLRGRLGRRARGA